MKLYRQWGFASLLALGWNTPVWSQAQPLAIQPIVQVSEQAMRYITTNGSHIARLGTSNADQLIGRAVPCAASPTGTYTLSTSTAYAMEGGRRFRADASSMGEPLMILASGVVAGELGIGPLTASASNNRLTRLDISETVRLSIDTGGDDQPLTNGTVKRLFSLESELNAPNTHWCIVDTVSVWRVRYEIYRRQNVNTNLSGFWIISGNSSYSRDNSAVIPYQVVTMGITPYSRAWVRNRAAEIARAEGAPPAVVSPALVRDVALRDIAGSISDASLAAGDAAAGPR